jgi:spore coat polysaccharide biosynthesis protein SpsF (cytidylyltransferase family)
MDYTKFQRLLEGLDVEIVRMNRLKELYRKGITKPQETLIRKKLRQKVQAKRFFYPDGHSRPWHVEELEK